MSNENEKMMSVNIAILKLTPPLRIENTIKVITEYTAPTIKPLTNKFPSLILFINTTETPSHQ